MSVRDSFNENGFEGTRAMADEGREIGHHANHVRDRQDWDYSKRFRNEDSFDYSGKGPKDYRRSDESIYDEVCYRLTHNGMVDASDIEVKVDHGYVILQGKVSERAQKKEAERCVEDISGVEDVLNYITLKKDRGLIGDAPIRMNML